MSGGEKQRVALARALILEPKLLLLDEPLSSLDMPLRELLRKELKRIHSESKTTFIQVTHDFEEAVFLADRIALMQHGMIIQIGTPEEIMRRPINHFVAEFVGVRNIIKGFLVETGSDLKLFESRAMRLQVNTIVKGNCHVSIPAEDILISKEKIESSARNSMHGTIVDILPRGRTYEIIIDVGQRLIALVTKRSLEELELKKGKNVWATFKTSEIHVF